MMEKDTASGMVGKGTSVAKDTLLNTRKEISNY